MPFPWITAMASTTIGLDTGRSCLESFHWKLYVANDQSSTATVLGLSLGTCRYDAGISMIAAKPKKGKQQHDDQPQLLAVIPSSIHITMDAVRLEMDRRRADMAREAAELESHKLRQELRVARKDTFRTSRHLIKVQEEVVSLRNTLAATQASLELEQTKASDLDEKAFKARYALVAAQEELDKARQTMTLIETERDSLAKALKEEEAARVAAENRVAQHVCAPSTAAPPAKLPFSRTQARSVAKSTTTCGHKRQRSDPTFDRPSALSSTSTASKRSSRASTLGSNKSAPSTSKSVSKGTATVRAPPTKSTSLTTPAVTTPSRPASSSNASDNKENVLPVIAEAPAQTLQSIESLKSSLASEQRLRVAAEETIHHLLMECQFGTCACRIAEACGTVFVHDAGLAGAMESIKLSIPERAEGDEVITPPTSEDDDDDTACMTPRAPLVLRPNGNARVPSQPSSGAVDGEACR